ncbi:DUF1080 domain-containing protein [candidate division KSB1 bacterium]
MKSLVSFLALCCIVIMLTVTNCQQGSESPGSGPDLSEWEFFVGNDSVDVNTVWTVQNGVIHCTGITNGYIRSATDYENYELNLEWRWVEEAGNSGVLLHAQLPDRVWPLCVETQLRSGSAGDFVLMGGAMTVEDEEFMSTGRFVVIPKMQESTEKAIGEWNSYRAVCVNDEITCYVNDVLQNKGVQSSLVKGKICLQSEGAPIEFRNIRIEPLQ